MESDHYIEFICAISDNTEQWVHLEPSDEAEAIFDYYPNMKLYEYCNKHGLWVKDVD